MMKVLNFGRHSDPRLECAHKVDRATAAASMLVVSVMSLTGCTAMFTPLGDENYDCNRKENPDSPYCHSFRSVEQGTNKPLPDSRYDDPISIADLDRRVGIAPSATAAKPQDVPSSATRPSASATVNDGRGSKPQPALGQPAEGAPVRTGPLVVRTWVKRHVDNDDRLVAATYVYKEVQPAHWTGFEAGAALTAHAAARPHWPASGAESVLAAGQGLAKSIAGAAGAVVTRSSGGTQPPQGPLSGFQIPAFAQPGVATPGGGSTPSSPDGGSMPQ